MDVTVTDHYVPFKSKYITDELVQIFAEDTDMEDEEFEGFDEDGSWIGDGIKCMSENSEDDDDDEDDSKAFLRRKSSGLCVAFRFPTKKAHAQRKSERRQKQQAFERLIDPQPVIRRDRGRGGKRGAVESVPSPRLNRSPLHTSGALVSESGNEDMSDEDQALQKRATNIKENKAMLEKLLADLSSMPVLIPVNTQSASTPSPRKKSNLKKAQRQREVMERRNPARSARPPPNFGAEYFSISPTKIIAQLGNVKAAKLKERITEVNHEGVKRRRKFLKHRTRDDITEEELENVAYSAKDKIYDKEHGSTCHQCRQKTIDTKTICRNPNCWGVRGQFCGPCLRNRYGEDVRTVLQDSMWVCPPCRGICNCSFCRKADGRCATGMLIKMAKYYGHSNVKEYLESLQESVS